MFEILLKSRDWIALALLLCVFPYSTGYFEFCSGPKLFQVKHSDCPGGIVFQTPVEIKCTYPQTATYMTDICTGEKFDPSGASGTNGETMQVQVIEMANDDDPSDMDKEPYSTQSCRANPDCVNEETLPINSVSSRVADPDDLIARSGSTFGSEERDNVVDGVVTDDNHVKEQTHRVLMFLNSLIIDEDEQGPNLRIVEVLKKSFEVLQIHCPNPYVPKIFGEQVLKAFLFLVREGDLAMVKDIDEDDHAHIMAVLNDCAEQKPAPAVRFNGKECETRGIIFNITMASRPNMPAYILQRNELSFRWGKYDPPVDATWGVTDFVHGLCYGKFKENVNKHHLYQRAMEMLFTPEIIYRWQRPYKLNVPEAWDHALRASMKDVMKNLEGCVQGAYIGSPFLHRLERPMARFNASGPYVNLAPSNTRRRRKRSMSASILEEISETAYCFQDAAEKQKMIDAIKQTSCDGTEKASGADDDLAAGTQQP